MKRVVPLLPTAAMLAALFAPFAFAAGTTTVAAHADRSPGAPVAAALSTVTGIAISPLLGTSAYGAFRWFEARDDAARARLPWFAQPKFWVPALLIVALVAAKDALGAGVPPGLKKPLDVLETMENKVSGLVAAGAVVPMTVDAFSKLLVDPAGHVASAPVVPLAASGLAALPLELAALDWHWLLDVLLMPLALAVFVVVWLASHAIHVLILLSPWGAIDAALKSARAALLGLVALTAALNPWVGALLSVVVVVAACFIAGWALRLTVCGAVFCWDYLTLRRNRCTPAATENRIFAGANFPGVPARTYGRLVRRGDGALEFVYRPWLVWPPRTTPAPAEARALAVGRGLIFSTIIAADGRTLFLLPPRFRGHEAEVVQVYAFGGGVRDAGLRKAWSALREMLGGRTAPPAAA